MQCKRTSTSGGSVRKIQSMSSSRQFMTARKYLGLDYIYLDDSNELANRLRLLITAQVAGNTSNNYKIIYIIEKLWEAQMIY